MLIYNPKKGENMSNEIKIFLKGIANSLNPDGYYHIVSSPRTLGETTEKINLKRKKNHNRIKKVINEKYLELTN